MNTSCLIRTRETEQPFFSKTFKKPFKNANRRLLEVGTSCGVVPGFWSKRSKTGAAGGGFGVAKDPPGVRDRALLAGLERRGAGGGRSPKTLAPQGLLRAFVGPTRGPKTTPAGAFPRRTLFSQSDLGVCKTGGGKDPGADHPLLPLHRGFESLLLFRIICVVSTGYGF